MKRRFPLLFLVMVFVVIPVSAQSAADDEKAIRDAITAQAAAWDRADIPGFMQAYEDSNDTTFMGTSTVRKGTQEIRKRYEANYSNPAQMGKLTFSEIEIRLLNSSCAKPEFAFVTGKFHLARTERSAGQKDDGIFSLILRKGPTGWKIILDHTST
jgi:uncharacterized protein (TIGR02246 family)